MKDSSLARFRGAGSFMAGILIGLSIMVPMFALMVVDLTEWQTFLFFGAPFILALGIALQAAITAKARHCMAVDCRADNCFLARCCAGFFFTKVRPSTCSVYAGTQAPATVTSYSSGSAVTPNDLLGAGTLPRQWKPNSVRTLCPGFMLLRILYASRRRITHATSPC